MTVESPPTPPTLRERILRGGAYLTMRQAVGTALNVVGVVLLTRAIGPGGYGTYAAATALLAALQLLAQVGVGVYLVRAEGSDREEVYQVSSTLLLATGVLGTALGALALPLAERWTRIEGLAAVALAVFATLTITNLAQVPLARLERALDYRGVAWIELAGQATFFLVSLPLALLGWGAWAPTLGLIVQQTVLAISFHVAARYRPRPRWDAAIARDLVGYGAGFTGSLALFQLRRVVNPLVVGRWWGADAVGVVAVAAQIVTHLSFVSMATWRLSMAALARVREPERLRRAVGEGMKLQLFAVAPFLIAFAWLAPLVVPLLLGRAWSDIAVVYPFLATAALANATFNLHSSALYVLRANGSMAVFHIAQTTLLAVAALALVPRLGLLGYGLAELVALASYGVLHWFLARAIGAPASARALAIGTGLALALGWPWLGPWGLLGLALVALLRPWREVSGLFAELRGMSRG